MRFEQFDEPEPPPPDVCGEVRLRVVRDVGLSLLANIGADGGSVLQIGRQIGQHSPHTPPERVDVLVATDMTGGFYLIILRRYAGQDDPECVLVNLARLAHLAWHCLDGSTCRAGHVYLAGEDPTVSPTRDYRLAKDKEGYTASDYVRHALVMLENTGVAQPNAFRTFDEVTDLAPIVERLWSAIKIIECGQPTPSLSPTDGPIDLPGFPNVQHLPDPPIPPTE